MNESVWKEYVVTDFSFITETATTIPKFWVWWPDEKEFSGGLWPRNLSRQNGSKFRVAFILSDVKKHECSMQKNTFQPSKHIRRKGIDCVVEAWTSAVIKELYLDRWRENWQSLLATLQTPLVNFFFFYRLHLAVNFNESEKWPATNREADGKIIFYHSM